MLPQNVTTKYYHRMIQQNELFKKLQHKLRMQSAIDQDISWYQFVDIDT